jgi:hypothetical protein
MGPVSAHIDSDARIRTPTCGKSGTINVLERAPAQRPVAVASSKSAKAELNSNCALA